MFSIQQRLGLACEPINGAAWQWACALRVAIPGIVISFDEKKLTCVAQVAVQERVLLPQPATSTQPNPTSAFNVPTDVSISPLQDVPVIFPHVNGWSMTMPITPGTECLLIFADMCIDGWWDTGKTLPQYDRRRHDLSDAFALFGPWSQPFAQKLQNYSTNSVQLRSDDGTVLIDLASDKITIQAPSQVLVKAPTVDIQDNGTPNPLVNKYLVDWIDQTLIPTLASHMISVSPPPANVITTVVKGE